MFDTVIVVDHGVTAVRVIRTCQRLDIQTIAVHGDEDGRSPHVRQADDAVPLGGRTTAVTYGDARKLLEAAQRCGAQAVHPGAGALATDAAFAGAVVEAGLIWLGAPTDRPAAARSVEAPVAGPRTVVTVLHDGAAARAIGRRSRLGAVVDEEPDPTLDAGAAAAVDEAVVGFLAGAPAGAYAVEVVRGPDGPVATGVLPLAAAGAAATAAVTGTDALEVQLRAAAGERVEDGAGPRVPVAVSLNVRVPEQFGGRLRRFRLPGGDGVLAECGVSEGGRLSAHTGRLLAVVTATGPDRGTVLDRARAALAAFEVAGVPTNLPLLRSVLDDPSFVAGAPDDELRERTRRA
ncbi:MAG: biotin carboxylase N-terminal domain-containing protein [Actinomycetes bacterium]